jgi:hypothetical protein
MTGQTDALEAAEDFEACGNVSTVKKLWEIKVLQSFHLIFNLCI